MSSVVDNKMQNRANCATLALFLISAAGCSNQEPLRPDDVVFASTAAETPSVVAPEPPPVARVAAAAAARTGPILRVEDLVFDWGITRIGNDYSHTFVLHNDGDEVLQICEAKTNCGCAAIFFDRKILPGKMGRVDVLVNGAVLKQGKARARIELVCNDPRAPDLVLKGKVEG